MYRKLSNQLPIPIDIATWLIENSLQSSQSTWETEVRAGTFHTSPHPSLLKKYENLWVIERTMCGQPECTVMFQ